MAAINRGDIDAFDDLCAEDYVWRGVDPEGIGEARGLPAFKEAVRSFLKAMPDLHVEILEMVAEDDAVATHLLERGHHTGSSWLGVEPQGALVEWHAFDIYRIRDGKLAAESFLDDSYTIMKALGIRTLE
jgi:predicted ester cyclase